MTRKRLRNVKPALGLHEHMKMFLKGGWFYFKALMIFTAYEYRFCLKIYLFIFQERGKEGERKGEKHRCERETCIRCLWHTPSQDQTGSPGMCPDQKSSNWQPFAVQDDAQPTEPHQSGHEHRFSFFHI